jgi:hypothetical protein
MRSALFWQWTVRIVRDSSRPRDNLTGTKRKALRALRKNTDLTILLADRGKATVVPKSVEYSRKIGALLEGPAYRRLARDATEAVKRKTILLLNKSTVAEEVGKRLRSIDSRPPRLYWVPKIHKEGVPLRPIVSNTGAPTCQTSKYLAGILGPLVGHSVHHVRNSIEFVHTLGTLRVGAENMIVSLYVVFLFTRVPIVESLNLLLSEDILALFRHAFTSTYFSFGSQFYK